MVGCVRCVGLVSQDLQRCCSGFQTEGGYDMYIAEGVIYIVNNIVFCLVRRQGLCVWNISLNVSVGQKR